MIRKIVNVKDPKLRKKSKKINKFDKKTISLIKDLKDTIKAQKDPEGVGLAASQIGKNQKAFVINYNNKISAYINPEIISKKKLSSKNVVKNEKKILEGCLSLPHFYGPLSRSYEVKVKFTDEKGNDKVKTYKGIMAQIVQHEIDHLSGILFIDRLIEQKKPLYENVDGEWEKVELI